MRTTTDWGGEEGVHGKGVPHVNECNFELPFELRGGVKAYLLMLLIFWAVKCLL